ncbi:hypothetical protein [Sorangium atrum]|uniref:DUF3618 domain-containing protein n=1 Tax=Sorangium atrum TaxID=2995308 RepID=A0ABT5CFK2_9BACT|nr:hypothetical protein [Sorangium aterium]MDC0683871.1 hypothetical protein [Sorangium aterium]
MKGLNGQRADFERRADELRDRLMHTIEALDRRRHVLVDVRSRVRRHGPEVLAGGLLLAIAGGAAAIALIKEVRARNERPGGERLRALVRFWRHPERVAPRGKPSVSREIGRRILVGMASFVAIQLIRRGVRLTLALPDRDAQARRGPLELSAAAPGTRRPSGQGPV